ncbi:hypothetical protein [Peribacillus simplex]|uniref:hypothetical protein n=1 Tax=Peribacillus simplex TaxID=1478 RepID=UPI003D07F6D9
MYYDSEDYLSSINSYRSQLFQYLQSDQPLIQYFYEKLEFNDFAEGKSFSSSDFHHIKDHGFTNVDLVTTLSDSLLITLYGKYEYLLTVLCDVVQGSLRIGISYKMMKGQGIIASIKYLDNLLNIDIGKSDIYRNNIAIWLLLRNIIAHNYSVPDESHYVQLYNINIHTDGEKVLTSMNDCIRLITDFKSFFNLVFDKLLNIEND